MARDGKKGNSFALKNIFHPSDFTEGSEVAFAHALKLALVAKADINIFHINPNANEEDWKNFPGVRSMLEQWGILPVGSSQEEVGKLGLGIHKVLSRGKEPAASILRYLETQMTDLIVLTTNQRVGLDRWLHQAIADPLVRHTARHTKIMTLFIPSGMNGFVSCQDGKVHLNRVLIPVDRTPHAQQAIDASSRLVQAMKCKGTEFAVIHVGTNENFPVLRFASNDSWKWEKITRTGSAVDVILNMANEYPADLIVMATEGQHGFLDALRGSTTERVLREIPCPILAVPVLYE